MSKGGLRTLSNIKEIPSGGEVALQQLGRSLAKQLCLGSQGSVMEDNWLIIYMHFTSDFSCDGRYPIRSGMESAPDFSWRE